MRMHNERERAGTIASAVNRTVAKRSRECGIAMAAATFGATIPEQVSTSAGLGVGLRSRRSRSFMAFSRF
jgi:hypothetical protein